ncbi:transglycosylase domain-containing protein [Actinorugispora endophytica]|uniref:transglycosylase domain-containing protein n=1 Tax=Actinorugispora endophytica TaxID=1605990 RepID=UPI001FB7070B|nr:transglycosylase domain-containing protein [Actinorugispora endophytica]
MDEPRGNGGRRGRGGPAEDERAAAGRRGPREEDGFWADERPRRSAPSRDEGERPRRSRAAQDDVDDRPRRSRRAGGDADEERPRRRAAAAESGGAGGRRRARGDGDPDERPPRRRRPDEEGRGGRRRATAHGARAESGRRRARKDEDEELDERGPVKRFFAKTWKPALITFSVLFILGVVGIGVAYVMAPSPEEMDSQADVELAATLVTFEDGDKATQFGESQRIPVTIDQIPDSVIDGVLAAEQRTFYEDGAINPVGLARGVVFGGTQGGGSTITQQMARNYYDGLTRNEPSRIESYVRKFNEIMIAFKVEQSLSKDQIIEQYLNTIYFGRGLGVQTAAQGYFGKDVSELDYAEGAFIGTVIQQPGNFGPAVPGSEMYDILQERWGYTVEGLVEMNAENPDRGLTQEEADALEFPEPLPQSDNDNYSGYRGYIQEAVRTEMADRYGLSDQQIGRGGYQITTTLNEDWMKYAEEVVEAERQRVLDTTGQEIPAETQFGITTVDPATGEIKAFYGGPDPTQYANQSLVQREQAGSAFKPYVLATALEQGISLRSTYDGDGPKEFAGLAQPVNNDSNVNYGPVDLIQSTKDSINTSYVQLAEQVTPPAVLATALAAGIPQEQLDTAEPGPNIALGTVSVSSLDQAGGFATFANGGVHMPRHMIKEIIGPEGEPLVPKDAELLETGSVAFSAETTADATYAMQQVITPDHNARLDDGRPMAGKTGTSNDAVSAWFVGFVPQLSTAVGLHRSDRQPLVLPGEDSIYGGQMPSRIWKAYMTKVLDGLEHESFPEPVYGGEVQNHVPTPTPDPSPSESEEAEPSDEPVESPPESPDESPSMEAPDCEVEWWRPECMEQESPGPGASNEPPDNGGGNDNGNDDDDDNGFL